MPEARGPATALFRRDEGTGPLVLLLHGLGGDHTVWDAQVPELAREFRVVAPDLRGHGRSKAPTGSTFSFAELEGDVNGMLDELGGTPAHVVGLSAGGFLALRMALDTPERVRSLTLAATSVNCDNHTKAVSQRWADTYRDEGFDAYLLRLVKDLYYPDWIDQHPEVIDRLRAQQSAQDLGSALAWAHAVRSFDLRGRLMKIKAPTRILQPMDDGVIDGSHGRLLRVSIPGADLKLFVQTGHLLPMERPSETTEAIREFVRAVEARPRAVS
ncbi:MAG: alpha/beta hydrolase [Thermoplasmata archaeon]|nr:alpha/beta hydrolase [Thermoplasmata archaeon]MCI4353769.1 alpha/beta hydrolase [Thermoplasmata archaeon]